MSWYFQVLKKYAVFSGRARRMEYWMFTLFNTIIWIVLLSIPLVAAELANVFGLLYAAYVLAILLPSLAVGVRRLHDTSRSGWWLLITLVPIIGGFVLLFFLVQDSKPGDNQYGANPKGATA